MNTTIQVKTHLIHDMSRFVDNSKSRGGFDPKKELPATKDELAPHIAAQTFIFRELAAAIKNFSTSITNLTSDVKS